jgi:carbon dioxide concentrating mechanism protein CcmO
MLTALGFIEIPFLSVAAVVADAVSKGARISILGFEASGNGDILIRVSGAISDVEAALAAADEMAAHLGSQAVTHSIARPEEAMHALLHFPNTSNPLYGGRDQFLPSDFPKTETEFMTNKHEALGILETQGLTAILEATDAMLKSANITLIGKEKIGAAYVTVIVRGDVAAVTAAVEAGSKAVGSLGKLIAAHVIARPHEELLALLPK